MPSLDRRRFLKSSLASTAALSLAGSPQSGFRALEGVARANEANSASDIFLAPFRFDVTPPMGHSLCGGWIKPTLAVDDSLEAIGLVLLGAGKPIVICAVDWTGLLNEAHVEWRRALAEAAGTTADRVAVQCVHQHNAPFACLGAERIVKAQGDLPHIVELDFFRTCLDRARTAVAEGVKKATRVTHVAHGQAKVEKVASNRRVFRDAEGNVKKMRGSSCRDPELIKLPAGLIDPWLKTVAFYDNDRKLAACHYYATHPMSYYGDGRVSSDFAGLARKQRQADEPDCTHLYFTGCAGNISAGKYNDGSKPVRPLLTKRMYKGIVRAEEALTRKPLEQIGWRTREILPQPRENLSAESLEKQINDKNQSVVGRNRPSFMLSWLQRLEKKIPIVLSSLQLDDISLLHLPAECFIEYQLRAQQLQPSRFVATAAYGDGGPWYIPTRDEYQHGGYEVSVAFSDPAIDPLLTEGIRPLLA